MYGSKDYFGRWHGRRKPRRGLKSRRVTHDGGRRPSFYRGQRKYSVARCGAILYDNSSFNAFRRRKFTSRPTCKKCQEKNRASKAYKQKMRRKDRKKQLENYRARLKRENVMRARFGLKPAKYDPPPPSDYWNTW